MLGVRVYEPPGYEAAIDLVVTQAFAVETLMTAVRPLREAI